MGKMKCPNCNSTKLEYFIEHIITNYYELNEKNEPTEEVIGIGDGGTNAYGYICKKCKYRFGGSMPDRKE